MRKENRGGKSTAERGEISHIPSNNQISKFIVKKRTKRVCCCPNPTHHRSSRVHDARLFISQGRHQSTRSFLIPINGLNVAHPSTMLRARPEFYRRNERKIEPVMVSLPNHWTIVTFWTNFLITRWVMCQMLPGRKWRLARGIVSLRGGVSASKNCL